MKIIFATAVSLCCIHLFACSNTNGVGQAKNDNTSITDTTKMKITIGTVVFTVTLNNNATVNAFKTMLPLTINMDELNGNEKFYYLTTTLPTNASAVGNIQVGDLMLYGNNCLVLFYEGFNTSYSYTRLGKIDNTAGLIAALGLESVTVKFEKKK